MLNLLLKLKMMGKEIDGFLLFKNQSGNLKKKRHQKGFKKLKRRPKKSKKEKKQVVALTLFKPLELNLKLMFAMNLNELLEKVHMVL